MLQVAPVARDEIEIRLDRGGCEQRIDHRRGMTGLALDAAGNVTPASYHLVAERQDPTLESGFERISRRHVAQTIGIIVGKIGDALIVFSECQDAQEKLVFIDGLPPSLDAGRAVRGHQGGDDIGIDQPTDHRSMSRP